MLPENDLSEMRKKNFEITAQKFCDNYKLTFHNPTGYGVYTSDGDTPYRGQRIRCIMLTYSGGVEAYHAVINCHGMAFILEVTDDGILDFSSLRLDANYAPGMVTEVINLFVKDDSLIQIPFESYGY